VSRRQPVAAGNDATQQLLDEVPAPDDEDFWNREYERQLFAMAAERIRPTVNDATWQSFYLTAVGGKTPAEVAKVLGGSVAAVYLAKSRIMVKLKAEIARMNAE
jgi:RNA polymerase sigma-70 factor (ECF subfamily)